MVPAPIFWPRESVEHSMGSQRVKAPVKSIVVFGGGGAFGR